MTDLQSILGYQRGSPYAGNPYLDINTPGGLIDMSNTPIDLIGIDNKGNKKKMKAGRKNPYKFEGDIVREFPMQQGGTYGTAENLAKWTDITNAIIGRRGDPNAGRAVPSRNINDPIIKFVGDVGNTPAPLAT